jgi:hypothetical protein
MSKNKLFVASIVTALFTATAPSFAADKGEGTSDRSSGDKCPMMKMMEMKSTKCMENMKGMRGMREKCPMMKAQDGMSSQQQSYNKKGGKTREQVMQELKEHQERMRTDRAYAQEWRSMYH